MGNFLTILIGSRERLSLQHRIVNLAASLGAVAFFQSILIGTFFHKNYIVGFVSFLLFTGFIIVYYLSRKKGYYKAGMYVALLLTLCIAVPVLWWQNNGIFGSIPYWLVYLAGVISVVLGGWKKFAFVLLTVAILVILASLDYLRITDSKMPYPEEHILLDLGSQIILVMVLTVLLISVLVREYVYEQKRVEELANVDYLSGLYTRRYMLEQIDCEIKKCKRYQKPFSLLLCDVDDFKKINDRYGHEAGDFVIQYIAQVFWRHIRETDVAARWGGEEFLLLFPETDIETTEEIARRLHEAFQKEVCVYQGISIPLALSFGLSSYTDFSGQAPAQLCIKAADDAMYKSKREGKNRITVGSCPKHLDEAFSSGQGDPRSAGQLAG